MGDLLGKAGVGWGGGGPLWWIPSQLSGQGSLFLGFLFCPLFF